MADCINIDCMRQAMYGDNVCSKCDEVSSTPADTKPTTTDVCDDDGTFDVGNTVEHRDNPTGRGVIEAMGAGFVSRGQAVVRWDAGNRTRTGLKLLRRIDAPVVEPERRAPRNQEEAFKDAKLASRAKKHSVKPEQPGMACDTCLVSDGQRPHERHHPTCGLYREPEQPTYCTGNSETCKAVKHRATCGLYREPEQPTCPNGCGAKQDNDGNGYACGYNHLYPECRDKTTGPTPEQPTFSTPDPDDDRLAEVQVEALDWGPDVGAERMEDEPEQPTCAGCGERAKGHATSDGERYCHEGASPTCYERASRSVSEKTTNLARCVVCSDGSCAPCQVEAERARIKGIIEAKLSEWAGSSEARRGARAFAGDLLAAIDGGDDAA